MYTLYTYTPLPSYDDPAVPALPELGHEVAAHSLVATEVLAYVV